MEELTAVCNRISVEVPENATVEGLTTAIKSASITSGHVNSMNKAELHTLCDVLEIIYDANATNKVLASLIIEKLSET